MQMQFANQLIDRFRSLASEGIYWRNPGLTDSIAVRLNMM